MLKAVALQCGLLLLVAALGLGFVGVRGGLSALLGGLAYLLPNLFFVVRLKAATQAGRANPVSFFMGELVKVVATVGILIAVQQWYADVHWIMMLVGLFAVLQANLFAFLVKT